MPVRTAVVGLHFGYSFACLYQQHPESVLTAICDLDPDTRERVGSQFPQARRCQDLHSVLADPQIDAVHLCTPAPQHAAQAIAAMEAGKHVMCAVPAATSLEDCQRLLAAQRRSGCKYMMAETSNYYPQVLAALDLQARGELGELVYCEADYLHPLESLCWQADGTRTWRFGFPPMFYPTHCTGPIIRLSGQRMREVVCFGTGKVEPGLEEGYGCPFALQVALFRLADGTTAKVAIGFSNFARTGEVRFAFYGTKKSIEGNEQRADQLFWRKGYEYGGEHLQFPLRPDLLPAEIAGEGGHLGSHPHLVHAFIMSLVGDTEPPINAREAVAYTAPGQCAHLSSLQGGKPVAIPDYDGG